ncbi:MAG: 4-hydroxyphenylpyruvate dioxygenase [Gammaproteobacteria bacterium]
MEDKNIVNPMGTDGFEFLEFSSADPDYLAQSFEHLGFELCAVHRSKKVSLYRQGDINFLLNAEDACQAEQHANKHGTAACAMGFRVKDADVAYVRALKLGAEPHKSAINSGELKIPAIKGIGGSVIYFVDRYQDETIYDTDFVAVDGADKRVVGAGLKVIDHLTHNVQRGHMDAWAEYYEKLFNFRQIRFFDIKGQKTGLISRAMGSPCGKIKIPLNEATDDKSQIEEFLDEFHGEGIQHIALSTDDIYETVEDLRQRQIGFLKVPATYYETVDARIPWQQEDIPRLQKNAIIIDGGKNKDEGLLLQIFTKNMFGPEFFEIIQRKGNDGFGEGNFQALFEAIERDQIKRGVL